MSDDYRVDAPDLGPCCVCERTERVNNILMLDRRGAVPGTGWGCVVCGLPADGAVAVLCDDCVASDKDPIFACLGYPMSGGRIRIAELPEGTFAHDDERHVADMAETGVHADG